MAHAEGAEFQGGHGDPLTQRTLPLFFEVLRVLLEASVTVVAEAAFQDRLWRGGLDPLVGLALFRVVRCRVDAATSFEQALHRAALKQDGLKAHGDSTIGIGIAAWAQSFEAFQHISLGPSIDVDTSDGYDPGVNEIVDFINRAGDPAPNP